MKRLAWVLLIVASALPATACGGGSGSGGGGVIPVPASKLLITEISVQPATAEFVEIYNPTSATVNLRNYYLADYATYYEVTTGTTPLASDFNVRFPVGASIAAGGVVAVAIGSASDFFGEFGANPDFDLAAADAGAPSMEGSIGASVGLGNTAEMLVLFYWDGAASKVQDVDYVLWGSTANAADKTGVGSYLNDTAAASQDPAIVPAVVGQSIGRPAPSEGAQTVSGGNGVTGADETSEDFSNTFTAGAQSPGSV